MIIVDEILDQMEAVKSGVVPGSVNLAYQPSVENVLTQLIQQRFGGASSSNFTTYPLFPVIANCSIDKSFVHLKYKFRFGFSFKPGVALTAASHDEIVIPLRLGLHMNSQLPNMYQLLIENATFVTSTFQRQESVLSYNSLPETEIRGNQQYSSIEKMQNGIMNQPMKRILIRYQPSADVAADATIKLNCEIQYETSIDLNRLTPLLSNMHYTTKHVGRLRLRLFFQQIEKAFYFCPDYACPALNAPVTCAVTLGSAYSQTDTAAAINTGVNAAIKQMTFQSAIKNSYWSFYPLSEYIDTEIDKTVIPFYGYVLTTVDTARFIKSITAVDKVKFSNLMSDAANVSTISNTLPVFECSDSAICQTTFDIRYEEYQRLESHYTSMGSIILPTQTWQTNPFDGAPTTTAWNQSYVGVGQGNNIDMVAVWATSNNAPGTFYTLPLKQIQLLLNGSPLVPVPYPHVDERAITDFTQALMDTDNEEINHDYLRSLRFLVVDDANPYAVSIRDTYCGTVQGIGSVSTTPDFANPNTFAMVFSTNLPNSFHTGKCVLEDTVNTPKLQLIGSYDLTNQSSRNTYPIWYDNTNATSGTQLGFSLFCDTCIVLKYDAARGVCFDGLLSFAAPYI